MSDRRLCWTTWTRVVKWIDVDEKGGLPTKIKVHKACLPASGSASV